MLAIGSNACLAVSLGIGGIGLFEALLIVLGAFDDPFFELGAVDPFTGLGAVDPFFELGAVDPSLELGAVDPFLELGASVFLRSEERRVGKEC